jgi:hypothetical protein
MARIGRYSGVSARQAILSTVCKVRRRRGMTSCWEWCAGKDGRGYGWLTFERKKQHAHRLAYRAWRGEIPEGMLVLHECDVPACCNPDHLKVGTQSDNMRDRIARGRYPRRVPKLRAIARAKARDSKGRFV